MQDIPVVSEDDLRSFRQQHFPNAPEPYTFVQAAEDVVEDVEDDLGYYPDGVKRTLTDAQIAIFRHSEVQAIVKKLTSGVTLEEIENERRLTSLRNSAIKPSRKPASDEMSTTTESTGTAASGLTKRQRNAQRWKKSIKPLAKKVKRHEDSEVEIRHDPEEYMDEQDGRTFRRQARELDERAGKVVKVELDYD